MIKNIIFDMGGVLLRFEPDYFIARLGITGSDADLLHREVFRSADWVRMDRGTLTDEEGVRRICARLPAHLHKAASELICRWEHPEILPMEGMADLIGELKAAGYGIYLLSNAFTRQHEYWHRVPGSEYFDDTLISADVKLLKPQREIYELALNKFGINADECMFIDDRADNIEMAETCGIRGIVFHGDTEILRSDLRRAGVVPRPSMHSSIRLVPMTAEMYHEFFKEYQNDPDLYIDPNAYTPYVYNKDAVDRYIRRQSDLRRKPFAIMHGDEIVGELILKNIEDGKCATLGLAMKNETYKDRGFGTKAEQLAIRYVFHAMDIPILYADSILTNTRSQHVLEKVGFRHIKTEGNFKYYCIER